MNLGKCLLLQKIQICRLYYGQSIFKQSYPLETIHANFSVFLFLSSNPDK